MQIEWFKGAREEEARKERQQLILSARPTLAILKKLLETRVVAIEEKQTAQAGYDSPNWAYQQADYTGAKRTLQEIIRLLTIEEEQ